MAKKGLFYTTAAIILTLTIMITFSALSSFHLNERMGVIETRIETVNFFIKDVEKDMNNGLYIASFRTLLAFNQYITSNGLFLDNVNYRFSELFLNGTIYSQPVNLTKDSTFTDWANKITARADKANILFNYKINSVKLSQSNPWAADIELNLSLDIRDKKNTSYWLREKNLKTSISLIDFEDPLYIVNSQGRLTNTIATSNLTNFVVDKNVQNLMLHMNKSNYISHNDSPSYLMRLEGNLSNSTYGIESLVNVAKFQDQGFVAKDRSIVDFIYFGAQNTVNFRINHTPSWFKIDRDHLDIYQVRNITCDPADCVTS